MITLKDFMEVVDYKITEGSDFTWTCFDDKTAYTLSAWNGDHSGWTMNITFDTQSQTVYMVEACDYKRSRAYRLFNPDYAQAYKDYAKKHNEAYRDQAWDDVDYVDLETDNDWLSKARGIVNDEEYDTRVQVPVEFTDEELLKYMKMAHEMDITFNQFVEDALRDLIEKHKDLL